MMRPVITRLPSRSTRGLVMDRRRPAASALPKKV